MCSCLVSFNNSTTDGTKVFIEAFSSTHPYAHIIAGKDDENTSSGFKFQTRDVNGTIKNNLTFLTLIPKKLAKVEQTENPCFSKKNLILSKIFIFF